MKGEAPPTELYAWGANNHGQLGWDSREPFIAFPDTVPIKHIDLVPSDIKGIYTGVRNTFIVLKNGQVYGCGMNNVGQLGRYKVEVKKFVLMGNLSEYCIRTIDIMCESCYALSEEGTCIGWGSNTYGQLSLDPLQHILCRLPVEICEGVKKIAAGFNFFLLLTIEGQVFSCGDGRYGQLGRISDDPNWELKEIDFSEPVRAIACGQYHAALITETNKIFVWGQCNMAVPDSEKVWQPTEVVIPIPLTRLSKIYCGWKHIVVFVGNGELYIFGENNFGQLGSPPSVLRELQPVKFNENSNVKKASAGFAHTAIIVENGIVLCWGDNESGSCGIASKNNTVIFPLTTRTGIKTHAKRVFSGYKQTFVLSL